jgi:ADP-heptose:LPS heptosyltransferase
MLEELQNFLLRRQLLAMEGKRIQAWLKEIEWGIMQERERLIAFRGHLATLATPPLVLKRSPEAAPRRRTTARDLPRIVERYVRNKRKKLFARLKQGGPKPMPIIDRTRAHDEQPRAWHIPCAREVDAWANLFAAFNRASMIPQLRLRESRLQAAFVVGGGIGDVLKSTSVLASIVDRFSCDIIFMTDQTGASELLENNPYVKRVICTLDQADLADNILNNIPMLDLIVTWRYIVQFYIPPYSRIDNKIIHSFDEKAVAIRSILSKFAHVNIWPRANNTFSCEMARLGLRIHDVSTITSGQSARDSDPYGIPFFPTTKALRIVSAFLSMPYITVHNGFDTNYRVTPRRKTNYASTKNISGAQWQEIVLTLRRADIQIIQLGVVEESEIPGVNYYLNGQTSLSETALLLKHAICHIDTEGGLVHLARAVHGRSVVLFGPTPAEVFGYPQNINLEPPDCKGCWFVTSHWLVECPRHTSGPQCMRGHSAERVVDAVNTIMSEHVTHTANLIRAETEQSQIPHAELIAATRMRLASDSAQKMLLIVDGASYATGMELPAEVLDRIDIMVCPDHPHRSRRWYGSAVPWRPTWRLLSSARYSEF